MPLPYFAAFCWERLRHQKKTKIQTIQEPVPSTISPPSTLPKFLMAGMQSARVVFLASLIMALKILGAKMAVMMRSQMNVPTRLIRQSATTCSPRIRERAVVNARVAGPPARNGGPGGCERWAQGRVCVAGLESELVAGEGVEVDEAVDLRAELPGAGDNAGDAHEEGEEERVILQHALHPGAALVVDEEHGDDLRRLDEEDGRVEQVGHEGRRPERLEHGERVLLLVGRRLVAVAPVLVLLVELLDLAQQLGPHRLGRHRDGLHHAVEVDRGLERGRASERASEGAREREWRTLFLELDRGLERGRASE